jgi:hypothetical protein
MNKSKSNCFIEKDCLSRATGIPTTDLSDDIKYSKINGMVGVTNPDQLENSKNS